MHRPDGVLVVAMFLGLAAVHVPGTADAQQLWGPTKYGMKVEEVSTLFPKAVPPAKAEVLDSGAKKLLELTGIDVVRQKFTAEFYFRNSSLEQVTLSLEGSHSAGDARLVVDELLDVLRSKYGREMTLDDRASSIGAVRATWIAGKTNIELFYFHVKGLDPTLNICYQVRLSREAEKL